MLFPGSKNLLTSIALRIQPTTKSEISFGLAPDTDTTSSPVCAGIDAGSIELKAEDRDFVSWLEGKAPQLIAELHERWKRKED